MAPNPYRVIPGAMRRLWQLDASSRSPRARFARRAAALGAAPFVFLGSGVVGVGLHLREIGRLVRSEMSLARGESGDADDERAPTVDSVPFTERRVEHIDYR